MVMSRVADATRPQEQTCQGEKMAGVSQAQCSGPHHGMSPGQYALQFLHGSLLNPEVLQH